jgi:RNA polymerase sigma factor (sigma-70 family)
MALKDRMHQHASDNPLLSREGFVGLYERHSKPLLVFFARRVYQAEVALDLTAETFAQAFASRRRFRGRSQGEQAAWLYAIARHQLNRYLRRGRIERRALARLGISVPEFSDDEYIRVEEAADLPQLRSAIADGLAQLGAEHRAALELRIVRELPYAEVARRLGVSEQTARSRVSRGLRALARALETHPPAKESMP